MNDQEPARPPPLPKDTDRSPQPPQLPNGSPQFSLPTRIKTPNDPDEGSIGRGIGIYFAVIVAGLLILPMKLLALFLPLLFGIWFRIKGNTETAKGIWLGFAIFSGLALLLVAACFGIMAPNGFH